MIDTLSTDVEPLAIGWVPVDRPFYSYKHSVATTPWGETVYWTYRREWRVPVFRKVLDAAVAHVAAYSAKEIK